MEGKKCPRCRRYDVEYHSDTGFWECPWKDCFWRNRKYEDPGMTKEEEENADKLLSSIIK